jgi:prepilin-type N-terminal cleavage/methylation domain-containing protein
VKPNSHYRPAFSLIEMLVAMSVGSVIMLLATMLINQSMQLSTAASKTFQHSATLARLASDLRDDAQQADKILSLTSQEIQLQLLDGQVVTWQLSPSGNRLNRSVQKSKSQAISREAYQFDRSIIIELISATTTQSQSQDETGKDQQSRRLIQILVKSATGIDSHPNRLDRLIELNLPETAFGQEQIRS